MSVPCRDIGRALGSFWKFLDAFDKRIEDRALFYDMKAVREIASEMPRSSQHHVRWGGVFFQKIIIIWKRLFDAQDGKSSEGE